MSCVHFKFKSSLDYEKVTFQGLYISLEDLRNAIMKQKKIGLSNEFTLEIVDAQTKKGLLSLGRWHDKEFRPTILYVVGESCGLVLWSEHLLL